MPLMSCLRRDPRLSSCRKGKAEILQAWAGTERWLLVQTVISICKFWKDRTALRDGPRGRKMVINLSRGAGVPQESRH